MEHLWTIISGNFYSGVFLVSFEYPIANRSSGVSMLIDDKKTNHVRPEACNSIKKETLAQVFSCEFCEIFKITFFLKNISSSCFYHVKK